MKYYTFQFWHCTHARLNSKGIATGKHTCTTPLSINLHLFTLHKFLTTISGPVCTQPKNPRRRVFRVHMCVNTHTLSIRVLHTENPCDNREIYSLVCGHCLKMGKCAVCVCNWRVCVNILVWLHIDKSAINLPKTRWWVHFPLYVVEIAAHLSHTLLYTLSKPGGQNELTCRAHTHREHISRAYRA